MVFDITVSLPKPDKIVFSIQYKHLAFRYYFRSYLFGFIVILVKLIGVNKGRGVTFEIL